MPSARATSSSLVVSSRAPGRSAARISPAADGRKRVERDLGRAVGEVGEHARTEPPSLRGRVAPERRDEQKWAAIGQRQQVLGELACGDVRPVEVLERDDHRPLLHESGDPRDVVTARVRRLGRWRRRHPHQPGKPGQRASRVPAEERAEPRPGARAHHDLRVSGLDAEPPPEHGDERPAAVRETVALEPQCAVGHRGPQLREHARLADARLAEKQERLTATCVEVGRDGPDAYDIPVPADEGAGSRGLTDLTRADESRRADRKRSPHRPHRVQRLDREPLCEASRGLVADGDRSGFGGGRGGATPSGRRRRTQRAGGCRRQHGRC